MNKNEIEWAEKFLKRIVGETRKFKIFNGKMYVSLGNNRVAYIKIGWPNAEKCYGYDSIDITIFNKDYGRIDSISIDFTEVCKRSNFQNESKNYIISCNKNRWFNDEPSEEVFDLIHNCIEDYLEIFEDNF